MLPSTSYIRIQLQSNLFQIGYDGSDILVFGGRSAGRSVDFLGSRDELRGKVDELHDRSAKTDCCEGIHR
jgi:hypothetical protein